MLLDLDLTEDLLELLVVPAGESSLQTSAAAISGRGASYNESNNERNTPSFMLLMEYL